MNTPAFKPPGPVRAPKREAIEAIWRERPELLQEDIARIVGCSQRQVSYVVQPLRLRERSNEPTPLPYLLHHVFNQVVSRLDVYAGRVKEGLDVQAACEFAG